MRFAIVLSLLVAAAIAAPQRPPHGPRPGNQAVAFPELAPRAQPISPATILQLLEALLGLRGGRGSRGGHPIVPLPKGPTTVKATTLKATTLPATTLPATTLPATTVVGSTIPATTLAVSTLPATTLPATTIPATTISADSSSVPTSAVASSVVASSATITSEVAASTTAAATSAAASATASSTLDCVVAAQPLPAGASALPAPSGTFVGSFTGTGTQNYQCSGGNSTSAPVSIGANANLVGGCGTGVHSFDNPTTPRFNMSELGDTTLSKTATVASPDGATNVAWIQLTAVTTTGGIVNVYRVNTKGGAPPATCGTNTGEVQVDYSASYFFYEG